MGAVVTSLGAPGTVARPMRESQTNSESWLGPYGYALEGVQALSECKQATRIPSTYDA
jgi:hypothetical protein